MTVSEALAKWLPVSIEKGIVIQTQELQATPDSSGLYRGPERNLSVFNDGSYKITEHYQMLVRKANKTEAERRENDAFFEELVYWIDDKNYCGDLPLLDGKRRCEEVLLTGSPYIYYSDEDSAVYQLSLSVTYVREHKEEEKKEW